MAISEKEYKEIRAKRWQTKGGMVEAKLDLAIGEGLTETTIFGRLSEIDRVYLRGTFIGVGWMDVLFQLIRSPLGTCHPDQTTITLIPHPEGK